MCNGVCYIHVILFQYDAVDSPHKGPVQHKVFPFHDIIMDVLMYFGLWLKINCVLLIRFSCSLKIPSSSPFIYSAKIFQLKLLRSMFVQFIEQIQQDICVDVSHDLEKLPQHCLSTLLVSF